MTELGRFIALGIPFDMTRNVEMVLKHLKVASKIPKISGLKYNTMLRLLDVVISVKLRILSKQLIQSFPHSISYK